MGMFDTIHCRYPLPFSEEMAPYAAELQGADYQTKDLHCALDVYELREDGTLWVKGQPADDATPPDAPWLWLPALSVVGHIGFYTSIGEHSTGWVDWHMTIVDGRLHRPIELVRFDPVDPVEETARQKRREAFLRQ